MSSIVVNLSNMDIEENKNAFRVGFVLIDGFPLMSYASAMEPLRAANLLAGRTLYNIRHVPIIGARSISSSGAVVAADAFLGEQVDFDLVLVVAGGDLSQIRIPRLESWLRLLASDEMLIGGVSGGPILLAHAGIMEGRRTTVHWEHALALAEISPRIIVERSLYVRDRDRLTCAGGTAPLDMMHALIAEHHGPTFARKISDWFLHTDIRLGDDDQRAGLAERHNITDEVILKALEAMENHIADPLELSQIAILAGLGARQLSRVFRAKLDVSTIEYYRQMRLQKAHSLLRLSSLSIQDIAVATGFANGAHFSRQYRQQHGHSPSQFRANLPDTRVV